MSDLLWVAVPGGIAVPGADGAEVVILRALVVPRLSSPQPRTVNDYGLANWPAVLAASSLTVEVAPNANAAPTTIQSVRRNLVLPGIWPRFFAPTMPVVSFQSRSYDPPVVESTAAHADQIVPSYSTSAQAIADPRTGVDPNAVVAQQYEHWTQQTAAPPEVGSGEREPWTAPDFHRSITFLREHPAVLLALGLIVEFELPINLLPESTLEAPSLIRVFCTPGPGLSADVQMVPAWTIYTFNGRRFLAVPRPGSDLVDGMIDLSRAAAPVADANADPHAAPLPWQIVTFDVDGAVGRLRDAARDKGSTAESDGRKTLPALRSTGLMLVRRDRAAQFGDRIKTAKANAALPPERLMLTADDLMLGLRIDVRLDGATAWSPLCLRKARYTLDEVDTIVDNPREEGQVKAYAATTVGSGETLRADEVVARWSGWNLVVPKPIFANGGVLSRDRRRVEMPFHLDWNFELAEPLPKLRFGSAYHMRIRVADIAGGGLGIEETVGNQHESDLVIYRRHDPVPPPHIPPPENMLLSDSSGELEPNPNALGPGGNLEQLVIRGDPAADLDTEAFAHQHPDYPANDVRMLLPPPGSMAMAEQHGRFDPVPTSTSWPWVQRATKPPVATADGTYAWLPDPGGTGVVMRVRPTPDAPDSGRRIDSVWSGNPAWPDLAPKSLQLVPWQTDMATIDFDPSGLRAVVALKPAEELILEISSLLDSQELDKFEIKRWLGRVSEATVLAGLHPMVTPARVVRLVHAVRRPLSAPAGSLRALRTEAQTFAVVNDSQDPLIGVNAASTVQVDVSATWQEWTDDHPKTAGEDVLSIPVERGATALPEIRHEFGDTRHRRVTYTLTAVSRFAQFFHPEAENSMSFKAATTFAEIPIPSSARPGPPLVMAITPSFRWEGLTVPPGWQELQRVRRGGRLRIELARPWNMTGEGEQLAVLTLNPAPGIPAPAHQFVSWVHRDPIWATPSPAAAVTAVMFSGVASTPRKLTLPEAAQQVIAVPYAVSFNQDRWYADVELPGPPATSYCPFARLAVARYQPESVPGLELSTVVRTEIVQLFSDRTLTLRRGARGLQVLLEGLGPVGPLPNKVFAVLELCDLPTGTPVSAIELTATTAEGLAAWRPLPDHAVEGLLNSPLPILPLPSVAGALRVVIREIEQIPPTATVPGDALAAELAQRTVFVDVVPITAIP